MKTGTDSKRNTREFGSIYLWHTSFKVTQARVEGLWFAYVWIRNWPEEDNSPELFFVPGNVVVKTMQQCKLDGDGPYFWMREADAIKKYRAPAGVQPLLAELRPTSAAII